MIQIYADGRLAYDSRLEDYDLVGLKITSGLNIGGTAEIVMPVEHPAYHLFTSYKTIVTIYRDGVLRFRGRVLYPSDTFYGQRTITCEGEMCLLRDGVSRPYLYQDTPANIFRTVINSYNSQVDAFKQFRLGEVTVVDPNEYLRLENLTAETVLDTINKLLERSGGYITFTTADDGARVIHWYATMNRRSDQEIEFGENLLDFARTEANTDLVTRVHPYGALFGSLRLTIEEINGGKDYIQDDEAVALRGVIARAVYWDDITVRTNLLAKAREYLAEHRYIITSLELSALDLSYMDKSIDTLSVGDLVRVISKPHGVDEDFLLSQITEDLLNPSQSTIILGKSTKSLTGSDVAGDNKGLSDLEATKTQIVNNYSANIEQVATELERTLTSQIEQSESSIILQVSDTYARKDALTALESTMTTRIDQTASSLILEASKTYASKTELGEMEESLIGRIETAAGSISMRVSGSLGSQASIVLNVGGVEKTHTLDLSDVRKAFANDKSNVVISGGTITFNTGTLLVNSTNFQLSANGTVKATNAELSGSLTTTSGLAVSKLSSGQLLFIHDGEELGTFTAGYLEENSTSRGVAIRLGEEATFIGFNRFVDDEPLQNLWYCINFGANPNGRTERHIFAGTSYFSKRMIVNGNIVVDGGYSLKLLDTDGSYINGVGVDDSTGDRRVQLGDAYHQTMIKGTSVEVMAGLHIVGSSIDIDNKSGMRGYTAAGAPKYILQITSDNYFFVGSTDFQTRLRGSAVVLHPSGVTVSSDRRKKNSIEALPDTYETLLDTLRPVRFKFNDGTSGRYHVGFIAQEVEEALAGAGLSTQDFGGFVDINGDGSELGLIYTEFIALLLKKIQRQEQRIAALEAAN